ncbi:MAG: hypothetical protein WAU24_00310 [Chitinophagaceae bacterium]
MDDNKQYSDDVFKNAGENYPLNTGNANWQEVLGRIQSPENVPQPVFAKSSQNKNWRYAWLLLLLLIPAGIWMANHYNNTGSGSAEHTNNALQAPQKAMEKPVSPGLPPVQNNEAVISKELRENIDTKKSNPANQQNFTTARESLQENEVMVLHDVDQVNQYLPFVAGNIMALNNANMLRANRSTLKIVDSGTPINVIPTDNKENDLMTTENDNAIIENNSPDRSVIKSKTKERFYLAIAAGPSFSSVKQQSIPKSGYSLGMLLGYTVNKNIEIETGVLFVKKYFKANGSEFNSNIVKLPEGTSIISLDGAANITQVPLNVIYHFNSTKSSNFFVSANLITNVIHSESYNYKLTGNENFDVLARSYKRGSDNLFSNLSIGVGFRENLGKDWKMSVEPYYQLPLSGIGLGDLRIQTFGINLKISKTVQKK